MLALLLLLAWGCQKVVRLDLEDAERRLVVEAILRDDSTQVINLKRTSNFYQQGQDPVQAARVILTGPNGLTDTLEYDAGGNYLAKNFQPRAYETYGLRIEDEAEVYTSGIIFPDTATIDSVLYEIDTSSGFGVAVLFTRDAPGIPNHYRVKYYRNGYHNPRQYNLFADGDSGKPDGGNFTTLVFLGTDIRPGDTLVMELQSLDEGSYQYLKELNKALNSSSTAAAPFNPKGNILGDLEAFGYFGGVRVDTVWYVVP